MANEVFLTQSFPPTPRSSSAPPGTVSLGLFFRALNDPPNDRFDYTFPGRELDEVTIVSFDVDHDSAVDKVELILNWTRLSAKPNVVLEPEDRGYTREDDDPAKQIKYRLEVPAVDHPDHVWHLADGEPSYKLQIQVRRKAPPALVAK